jgi:hypothetical protein
VTNVTKEKQKKTLPEIDQKMVISTIVVGTIPLKMHARGGIARTRGAWRLAAVRARALCFRGVMCARSSGVVRCRAN